jgi:hypothetical protein
MINQIGREVGRDIYRGMKNDSSKVGIPTDKLFKGVKEFQLSSYEKVTIKNLEKLVENVSEVNTESFNWNKYFIELDFKIDFCKTKMSPEYLERLEELDKINASNFELASVRHKNYVKELIVLCENKIETFESRNKVKNVILSFFGLYVITQKKEFIGIIHLIGGLIGLALIVTGLLNPEAQFVRTNFFFGIIFYLPMIISVMVRLRKERKANESVKESLILFQNHIKTV